MLLRNVRELLDFNMYSALSRQDKAYTSQDKYETVSADLSSSRTRKDALDTCILRVQELLTHRLGRGYTPRIVRLCEHYRWSETECRLSHLMVVVQGSTSPTVLNSLLECDENRRVQGFQRICRMSEVDVDAFCDAERQHIKEGIVMVEEELMVSTRETIAGVRSLLGESGFRLARGVSGIQYNSVWERGSV